MYRDFSNASKDRLIRLINEVDQEQWTGATDFLGDIGMHLLSIAIKLNIKSHIDDVSKYHKQILDKNNATKTKIYKIFDDVKRVDYKYCSYLVSVEEMLQNVISTMSILSGIVSPTNGFAFPNDLLNTLDNNFLQLQDLYVLHEKIAYEELGINYLVTTEDIPEDKVQERKNISISEFNPFMGLTKTMMELDDGAEALVSSPVLFDASSFILSWIGNSQSVTQLQVTTSIDGNMTIEYGLPIEHKYSGKKMSLNDVIIDKFYDYSPSIVFTADDKADEWIRSWFGLTGDGKYTMACEFGNVFGEFGYKLIFENGELYQVPIIHDGTKLNVYYKENGEYKWLFDAADLLRKTKIKLPEEEAEKVLEQLRENGYMN